jgi:transposase
MVNKEKTNENTVSISCEEYNNLINENKNLTNENVTLKQKLNWLEECLKLRNKKIFGSSSEKNTNEDSDQFNFFNEVELYGDCKASEPELTEVKTHYRKNKRTTSKDRLPEDIKVEIVEHKINCEEDKTCSQCGNELHEMGQEVVREELKIIPAKAVLVRHIRYSYACRNCEKNDISVPIVKAPVTNSPVKGGFASPESVAYIMSQKYVLDIPLYRQEQEFKRRSIKLSRQTMCNWLIKCAQSWLKPIYDEIHSEFLKCRVIHADETVLQVLKEPGKTAQSKSYMWLYRSGSYEEHQIALYDYAASRNAKHVIEFLSGFSGYLHVDAYQAYKKLPEDVTLVECVAHARRKFSEAVDVLTADQKKESKAKIGLEFCTRLFNFEDKIKDEPPEVRYTMRQEYAKAILDEFFAWLNTCNATPKSHFGRAVAYALNQWPYLTNYLLDGRLDISNNRAEHLAKSFAVCRKNFLFSNTPKGAESSAITYSIIATAMANNLDPFEYLTHIFRKAPNMDICNKENLQSLLPWNVVIEVGSQTE